MKKIVAPINQDSPKDVIAQLQEVFLFLLENKKILANNDQERERYYSGIKEDLRRKKFADYTMGIIRIFQQEYGLEESEFVDDKTAERINTTLRELRAI